MKLSEDAIAAKLAERPSWTRTGDAIARTFKFHDFVTAFGFMSSVALVAERMNHHPDWKNSYHKVEVELSTHDAKGLTENDFALAAAMDDIAAKLGAR